MKLKKKTIKNNALAKKPKKRKKPYFGKAEHNAIINYQECECKSQKNLIYEKEIRPAFTKLTENLIFIHGFATDKENFSILKSDCISFLYETLQKFDPHKGSKAFSYFNVCAKNFLIIQNKKKNKRKIRNINIDDENLSSSDKSTIENYQVIKSQEATMILNERGYKVRPKLLRNQEELLNVNTQSDLLKANGIRKF